MAEIDLTQLVDDALEYLPEANTLDCAALLRIAKNIVNNKIPENSDEYYSEALCKLLIAAGLVNKSKVSVDTASLRKEKVDQVEYEFNTDTIRFAWSDFLDSLKDVCPYLPGGGYNIKSSIGIKINPSAKFKINDCPNADDLIL